MTMQRARPTVKDVAALSGVSPKTVSNVLTGTVSVAPATRERVEAAIRELDYVPNFSARSLRNGRSGVVALALPDLNTAFSALITQLFVQEAHRRGLAVQIEETAQDPRREYELLAKARRHQIDGLILNPVTLEDSAVEHSDTLPPVVLIGEVQQHRTDHVGIDSARAGYDATAHLIARGARRIAAVGVPSEVFDTATSQSRADGYRRALGDAGIPIDPELFAPARPWTIEGGQEATAALLRRTTPDALFCFTDSLAVGALAALWERGLRVPEDVLVCGFDDVVDARFTTPPLTTVHFDHQLYVRTALDLLEERLTDRTTPPRRRLIPHRVIERASTAR
jgi:DNA-binding LacI/PurR family transcriptional regulator